MYAVTVSQNQQPLHSVTRKNIKAMYHYKKKSNFQTQWIVLPIWWCSWGVPLYNYQYQRTLLSISRDFYINHINGYYHSLSMEIWTSGPIKQVTHTNITRSHKRGLKSIFSLLIICGIVRKSTKYSLIRQVNQAHISKDRNVTVSCSVCHPINVIAFSCLTYSKQSQ